MGFIEVNIRGTEDKVVLINEDKIIKVEPNRRTGQAAYDGSNIYLDDEKSSIINCKEEYDFVCRLIAGD